MAKIRMSVNKKNDDKSDKDKGDEVKDLAEQVAKGVAEKTKQPPKPPKPPKAERDEDADDDLKIDPDTNYPKIALVRVSVGDDDERSMDEWSQAIEEALSDFRNVTIMTRHFLVDGRQVAAHHMEDHR